MLNTLDSRALQRADCYGQRFMKPGIYPYDIVPARGASISTDRPFAIKVRKGHKKSGMMQHNISVGLNDGGYSAETAELEIDVGDMVLWNCNQRGAMPFAVVGDHEFFNSNRLKDESGFSHAFGSPGEYHWVDAYGSKTSGVVRVKDPGCTNEAELKRWRQSLEKGTVIMINDGKAEPSSVDVVVGQTVFFMVVNGPGISITDARLLHMTGDDREAHSGGKSRTKATKR